MLWKNVSPSFMRLLEAQAVHICRIIFVIIDIFGILLQPNRSDAVGFNSIVVYLHHVRSTIRT